MNDKDFFSQVIGVVSPWRVKEVKLDMAAGKVRVEVEVIADWSWKTGDGTSLRIHGWEERRWRHLDTMQLQTEIWALVPRLLDPRDGSTKMADAPWATKGSRWTVFFEAWAVKLMEAVPNVQRAADLLGLDWHSAWGIKQKAVERGLAKRSNEPIAYLGLDEKSFGKGHDYATVLTDPANKRVLEVMAGRNEPAATYAIEAVLFRHDASAIKAVSMDMWLPFINAVENTLPNARIVFDPYHLVSHANQAVDQVRRQENRVLSEQGEDTLKGSRQMWLWGEENLPEQHRLAFKELLKHELKTGIAWALKEQLRTLWDYKMPTAARAMLDEWIAKARSTKLTPLIKVANLISSHLSGILAWFWDPISNGPSEGMNSAINALKVSARGYRNFANFRTQILFHHGKLSLAPH